MRLFDAQPHMLLFARLGLRPEAPFTFESLLPGFPTPLFSKLRPSHLGLVRRALFMLAQHMAFTRRGGSPRVLALGATGFDGRRGGHGCDPSQPLKVTLTGPGGTSESGVASMVTMRGTRRAGGGTGFNVVRRRLDPSALNSYVDELL